MNGCTTTITAARRLFVAAGAVRRPSSRRRAAPPITSSSSSSFTTASSLLFTTVRSSSSRPTSTCSSSTAATARRMIPSTTTSSRRRRPALRSMLSLLLRPRAPAAANATTTTTTIRQQRRRPETTTTTRTTATATMRRCCDYKYSNDDPRIRSFRNFSASSSSSSSSSHHTNNNSGPDGGAAGAAAGDPTKETSTTTSSILSRLALSGSPSGQALERALRLQPDAQWDKVVATIRAADDDGSGSHRKRVLLVEEGGNHDATRGDSDPHSSLNGGGVGVVEYDSTTDPDGDDEQELLHNEPSTAGGNLSTAAEQLSSWDEMRYKIQSTRQLLLVDDVDETPAAGSSWTTEDWFSAETLCRSVWSAQPCVRAVVLQFALLHRALLEQEALRLRSSSSTSASSQHHHQQYQHDNNTPSLDKWIGLSLLNRMLSNWRLVYKGGRAPDLAQNCHLAPHHLLDTVVADYHDRFNMHVSEWTMYLLLDADVAVWRPETPQFSQEILDTSMELYQTGDAMCKPKAQLFNCILKSWIPTTKQAPGGTSNAAAVAAVGEVFDCLAEHQIPPNGRTYKYALRIWSQQGTPDAALEAENLLQRMYAEFLAGTPATQPDVHAFTLVALAWARSGSPAAGPRCEEIYRQMELLREKDHVFGRDDISVINNALLAYSQSETLEALQHSEKFWRGTNVPGDNTTYTILIKQYAHLGRIQDVDRLIKEATTTTTVRADMSTYVLVFKAYSESKLRHKIEHANELLGYLERDPQIAAQLNTRVYNAYLSVVSRDRLGYNSGDIAERSLLKMIQAGQSNPAVRPDAVTYSTVMNAWARAGQPERAAKVLRRMYDDYYLGGNEAAKPDLQSFNTVMKAYTQSDYEDVPVKAEAFFHSMRSLAVMKCLSKTKDMGKRTQQAQKVEEVLHYMKTQYESGASKVRPNVYCYNSAIDAWARASNANKAEEIFLEMCEDYKNGNESAKPQTVTFNILMKAWAFSKRPEAAARAEQILQQMHDVTQSGAMHVPPDIRTYTSLVMCLGISRIPGAPQRAEDIVRHVDHLHQSGHLEEGPSRQTFETLIRAWKVSSELDKTENVARLQKEMNERFGKNASTPRHRARNR